MIVDLGFGPVKDIAPLFMPHSVNCQPRTRPHPERHCYRERELEDRVEEFLVEHYPHSRVRRQERWPGIGVVDLVVRTDVPFATLVTIIELKATPARVRAHNQLAHYVNWAERYYGERDERFALTGILGAFYIGAPPLIRPDWLAHWPMDLLD